GGTAASMHAGVIRDENLGVAEGVPGQRFNLLHTPVLSTEEPAKLAVSGPSGLNGAPTWVTWTQVADFASSSPDDLHFTIDGSIGEVRFGPAIRQQDGSLRRYGAVPPKDAYIRMLEYRTGGGQIGNVAKGAIRIMKTSFPFVSSVENRRAAI